MLTTLSVRSDVSALTDLADLDNRIGYASIGCFADIIEPIEH
jgi:hypothetical protein